MRKPHIYGSEYKASKLTVNDTRAERDGKKGRLLDYHHGRDVQVFWDLNKEAQENQMVKLSIGGRGDQDRVDLWLDAEQILQFLRWV